MRWPEPPGWAYPAAFALGCLTGLALDRLARVSYRTRYGYPLRDAVRAEAWWRVEHWPLGDRLSARAYRRRKAAERRGSLRRAGVDPDEWTRPIR